MNKNITVENIDRVIIKNISTNLIVKKKILNTIIRTAFDDIEHILNWTI